MPPFSTLLTLVINLDRSPHRLAQAAQQLQALDWPWERLSAADGSRLSLEDRSIVDVAAFSRKHGKLPLLGEVGCYLSHVWAMQRFLQTTQPYLLILEDDVKLGPDLPEVVERLMQSPEDWDVVMLAGIHTGRPLRLRPVTDRHWLAVALTRYAGSSAYLLTRAAAQAYLRDLLPMSLPYDHEYDRGWSRGLRTRIVTPPPCQHSFEDGSDLHPPGVVRVNFHWTRRWGTYAWRLRTDVRRLVHGLAQWWAYRR